jgi:hypothetical protein
LQSDRPTPFFSGVEKGRPRPPGDQPRLIEWKRPELVIWNPYPPGSDLNDLADDFFWTLEEAKD